MSDKATIPNDSIDSVLHEERKFECPPAFAEKAHVKTLEEYEHIYKESVEQPEKYWGRVAEELHWFKRWDRVLEWNAPWAKWFSGGQINLSYNCLDRHVKTWRKNKAALIWESEPGEVRTYTYQQLWKEVQKFANVLKSPGREEGRPRRHIHGHDARIADRHACVCSHWSAAFVVFGGFSSQRPGRSHPRLAGRRRHHAGRLLPPRRRSKALPGRRRGAQVVPQRKERGRLQAHRDTHQSSGRPRSLVA